MICTIYNFLKRCGILRIVELCNIDLLLFSSTYVLVNLYRNYDRHDVKDNETRSSVLEQILAPVFGLHRMSRCLFS